MNGAFIKSLPPTVGAEAIAEHDLFWSCFPPFFFPMKGSTPIDFGAAVLHCRDHETLMGMGTGIKCDQSCQGYKTNTNASYPFINPGTLKKLASTFNGITRT